MNRLADPRLLQSLRAYLKDAIASGQTVRAEVAMGALRLLDAAMVHAGRVAFAEREVVEAALEIRADDGMGTMLNGESSRIGEGFDRACDRLSMLRQSHCTPEDAEAMGVYPLTVCKDKFGGRYSGGRWVAWNAHLPSVPWEPNADDSFSEGFWAAAMSGNGPEIPLYGLGDTAEEAVAALEVRVREAARRGNVG